MTVARLLWMGAGALSLYGVVRLVPLLPCWAIFALPALVAAPIWRQLVEGSVLERRAVLAGVMREESRVRAVLWKGHVAAVGLALFAFVLAVALLAGASTFTPWHWAVIAADVVLLASAARFVEKRLARDVRAEHVGVVARRWPLRWGNVAMLVLGFMAVDFWIGAPDTRGMAWHTLAEQTFRAAFEAAACPAAGLAVGAAATADALSWHAAQVLIPGLPRSDLKLAAWGIVLLQAGVFAYAVTYVLEGMAAIAARRSEGAGSLSRGAPATLFVATLAVLAILFGLVATALKSYDPAVLADAAGRAAARVNPCHTDAQAVRELETRLESRVLQFRAAARTEADARVDAAVASLFAEAERGVDRYLEWHFSVPGQYQRLFAWVGGKLEATIRDELEKSVFGGSGAFGERAGTVAAELGMETRNRMQAAAAQLSTQARTEVQATACRLEGVNVQALARIDHDKWRTIVSVSTGAAVGVAVGAATAIAANAALRGAQAASHVLGKSAAGRVGSAAAGGAAACAVGGPAAVVCGLLAGLVTWAITDQVFALVDRALHRDQMRAELLHALEEQRAATARALKEHQYAAIDQMTQDISTGVKGMFIPARQGL